MEAVAINEHLGDQQSGIVGSGLDGAIGARSAAIAGPWIGAGEAMFTYRDGELTAMLEEIVERAGLTGVEAVLVHVGDDGVADSLLAPESDAVAWSVEQRTGSVVEAITAAADEHHVDLLVMSTDGHNSLLDALRGSHTERVVRAAHCAVLAVPSGIA